MKRRAFMSLLGGAAAWPLAVHAQQRERTRKVGVLMAGADEGIYLSRLDAFRRALQELGWIDGSSLQFDLRWGGSDMARIAALAEELVQSRPDVLLVGPTVALLPLQKATRTIPIVFVQVSDPLGRGIVTSLARPTGNVTGFSNLELSLAGKWLQLMKEIAPNVRRVSVMISIANVVSPDWYRAFEQAAPSLGIELFAAPIHERADIIRIVETAARPTGRAVARQASKRPPMRDSPWHERRTPLAQPTQIAETGYCLRFPPTYSPPNCPQFIFEQGQPLATCCRC